MGCCPRFSRRACVQHVIARIRTPTQRGWAARRTGSFRTASPLHCSSKPGLRHSPCAAPQAIARSQHSGTPARRRPSRATHHSLRKHAQRANAPRRTYQNGVPLGRFVGAHSDVGVVEGIPRKQKRVMRCHLRCVGDAGCGVDCDDQMMDNSKCFIRRLRGPGFFLACPPALLPFRLAPVSCFLLLLVNGRMRKNESMRCWVATPGSDAGGVVRLVGQLAMRRSQRTYSLPSSASRCHG